MQIRAREHVQSIQYRAELLENVVFQELKTYARLAQEQESVLIERLVETIYGSQNKEISLNKTKVSEYKNKLKSVNTSIKNLFEEKCSGSIPQDIFKQLMTKYSEERKLLEAKIEHFVGIIKSCNERNGDSEK